MAAQRVAEPGLGTSDLVEGGRGVTLHNVLADALGVNTVVAEAGLSEVDGYHSGPGKPPAPSSAISNSSAHCATNKPCLFLLAAL